MPARWNVGYMGMAKVASAMTFRFAEHHTDQRGGLSSGLQEKSFWKKVGLSSDANQRHPCLKSYWKTTKTKERRLLQPQLWLLSQKLLLQHEHSRGGRQNWWLWRLQLHTAASWAETAENSPPLGLEQGASSVFAAQDRHLWARVVATLHHPLHYMLRRSKVRPPGELG
jgi:hypothetical protein